MKPLLYRKRVEERAARWQLYLISDDEQQYAHLNEITQIREWLADEMDRYTVVNIEVEQVGETITLRVIGRETNGLEIDDEIKCFSFGLSALHFVEGTKQIQALYMETLGYFYERTQDNTELYDAFRDKVTDNFYTESAHFIYELIQNANDAGAQEINFQLHPDCIVIYHDALIHGGRCFDVTYPGLKGAQQAEPNYQQNHAHGCINAIASLGKSNKDGESSIGHFGVGFKSVFSFTNNPQIYEGDISFELPDLLGIRLCSIPDASVKILVDNGYTVFRLPFDKLPHEESRQRILDKFSTLQNPCLFLNNLKRVTFEDEDTKTRKVFSFERLEIPHNAKNGVRLIALTSQKEGVGESYIMGCRRCPIEHTGTKLEVELKVAFKYEIKERSIVWTCINNAPTYCYFATEAGSRLKFFVHAPFILTNNREKLKEGTSENPELLKKLAELASDTLVAISQNECQSIPLEINDSILDVIPKENNLYKSSSGNIDYNVFYTAILNTFREKCILPTASLGKYVSIENAYWAKRKNIQNVFTDGELEKWCSGARWCFPTAEKTNNGKWVEILFAGPHAEHLIDYEWCRYGSVLDAVVPEATDEWLHGLYKLIVDSRTERKWMGSKIWRTRAGRGKEVSAETPNVYVLPKGAEYDNADFHLITVSGAAEELATTLGIQKFNLMEVEKKKVKDNIFPLYGENDAIINISEEKHREHWKKITSIEHWQSVFRDELEHSRIFRVKTSNGLSSYEKASEIRFFSSSGLFNLFRMARVSNASFLDDDFYGDLGNVIKTYWQGNDLMSRSRWQQEKEEVLHLPYGNGQNGNLVNRYWEPIYCTINNRSHDLNYLVAWSLPRLSEIISYITCPHGPIAKRKMCSIEVMRLLAQIDQAYLKLVFGQAQLDDRSSRMGHNQLFTKREYQPDNPVGKMLRSEKWLFVGDNDEAHKPMEISVSQLSDAGYDTVPDILREKLGISRVVRDGYVQQLEYENKQLREKVDAYEALLETRSEEQRERDFETLRSLSQTRADCAADEFSSRNRAHIRRGDENAAIIGTGERTTRQPEIDTSVKFNEMSFADARAMMQRSVSCLVPLEKKRVLRTRNNPTGDFGEWTVCKALNLQIMKAGQAGYDAIGTDGKEDNKIKYQIKSVRLAPQQKIESVQLSAVREQKDEDRFDYLICLIFDNDYSVHSAFKFEKKLIDELVNSKQIEYVAYTNSYRMTLGKLLSAGDFEQFNITKEIECGVQHNA